MPNAPLAVLEHLSLAGPLTIGEAAAHLCRAAVYGSTEDRAEPHFLGWADELDADELFESGRAWGLTIRK